MTFPPPEPPEPILDAARKLRDLAVSAALTGGSGISPVPKRRRQPAGDALQSALAARVVLVTGASSGIGRAVAEKAAHAGAKVVLVARSAPALDDLARELRERGGEATYYAADLSSEESTEALLAALRRDGVHVDVLVNNAGRSIRRAVVDSYGRFHDFERTMSLNYFGTLRLVLGLLPEMRRARRGHIVNVSSAGVQLGTPLFSAYVASKAALDAFTRIAAAETRADGIHFSTVHMPLVRTPMIAPTRAFDGLPALTPEEAAGLVLRPLVTGETQLGTVVSRLFSLGHVVAPDALARFLGWGHRILARRDGDIVGTAAEI